MKKIIWILIALVLTANSSAFAKPERIEIKNQELREKHKEGKSLAKKVDFSKVEDPEARKALQAIFKTLNLQAKQ